MDIPLVLASVSALFSVGAVALVWMSRPSQLRRDVEHLEDAVNSFEREQIKHGGELSAGIQAITTTREAIADDLQAAEKKRRRAAAQVSAANGSQAGEPNWNDPGVIRNAARGMGIEGI